MASGSAPITFSGNESDNTFFSQDPDSNLVVTGGLGEDTLGGYNADQVLIADNATIFGGEGITSPNDDDDLISLIANTALVYGNGGDDFIFAGASESSTVYGGRGDDTIVAGSSDPENVENQFSEDATADVLVYGGEDEDIIQVVNTEDATVFGGTGLTDPLDGDDSISVQAETALIYGNGGDDDISVAIDTFATIYGGAGDDTIDLTASGESSADLVVYGGHDEDNITVTAVATEDGDHGNVTVFGGEGVTDPTDDDDVIRVGDPNDSDAAADHALVYGNGGDDDIFVSAVDSASVYGGAGDDTIEVNGITTSDDNGGFINSNPDVVVYGGHDEDVITVNDAGDVTVFGGEGITDPTDGDDTINVGSVDGEIGSTTSPVDNAEVYGNGGDDVIGVIVSDSASVFGGAGDDTIVVDQDDGATINDNYAVTDPFVSVFGGLGEDDITVTTSSANATVSGGESLDPASNGFGNEGDTLVLTHDGPSDGNATDVSGNFLLVGSAGDDAFTFNGLDGDEIEIRLGGDTDDVTISGGDANLNFTVDNGELDESDLAGQGATDIVFEDNTVTFTFDGIDVTLVGITDVNEAVA